MLDTGYHEEWSNRDNVSELKLPKYSYDPLFSFYIGWFQRSSNDMVLFQANALLLIFENHLVLILLDTGPSLIS